MGVDLRLRVCLRTMSKERGERGGGKYCLHSNARRSCPGEGAPLGGRVGCFWRPIEALSSSCLLPFCWNRRPHLFSAVLAATLDPPAMCCPCLTSLWFSLTSQILSRLLLWTMEVSYGVIKRCCASLPACPSVSPFMNLSNLFRKRNI